MSEGVEAVTRVMDAINRGDFDAAVANFSETFEFDFSNSRGPVTSVPLSPLRPFRRVSTMEIRN